MKIARKQARLLLAVGAALAYVTAFAYLQVRAPGSDKSVAVVEEALRKAPTELGAREKTSDCHARGPLPDPRCTPGAAFQGVTREEVCVDGYAASVRNVSASLKRQTYREYGLPYPEPFGSYEVDHLIPLSLGGTNDAANLWPEPANGAAGRGFEDKDVTENYLHAQVCEGSIDISVAERAIASDWMAIFDAISPDERDAIRAAFPSWTGRSAHKN